MPIKETSLGGDVLYEFSKKHVAQNLPIPEDQRIADWLYLLPDRPKTRTLVVGSGWGTVPLALAPHCQRVYVIDPDQANVALLKARAQEHGVTNIEVVDCSRDWDFPFPDGWFDMVSVRDRVMPVGPAVPFARIAAKTSAVLKEGGVAHFNVANRWSPQLWLRKKNKSPAVFPATIFHYERILRKSDFSHIRVYAPLPHYDGIPLFYLPLNSPRGLRFFFRNIFPLFDMVPPESRRAYALEYRVAKMGIRVARFFRLTGLTKYFVSGYSFIARKAGHDS